MPVRRRCFPAGNNNIGSRTGVDILKNKHIRKISGGFENFDDYFSDTEAVRFISESDSSENNMHLKNRGNLNKINKINTSATEGSSAMTSPSPEEHSARTAGSRLHNSKTPQKSPSHLQPVIIVNPLITEGDPSGSLTSFKSVEESDISVVTRKTKARLAFNASLQCISPGKKISSVAHVIRGPESSPLKSHNTDSVNLVNATESDENAKSDDDNENLFVPFRVSFSTRSMTQKHTVKKIPESNVPRKSPLQEVPISGEFRNQDEKNTVDEREVSERENEVTRNKRKRKISVVQKDLETLDKNSQNQLNVADEEKTLEKQSKVTVKSLKKQKNAKSRRVLNKEGKKSTLQANVLHSDNIMTSAKKQAQLRSSAASPLKMTSIDDKQAQSNQTMATKSYQERTPQIADPSLSTKSNNAEDKLSLQEKVVNADLITETDDDYVVRSDFEQHQVKRRTRSKFVEIPVASPSKKRTQDVMILPEADNNLININLEEDTENDSSIDKEIPLTSPKKPSATADSQHTSRLADFQLVSPSSKKEIQHEPGRDSSKRPTHRKQVLPSKERHHLTNENSKSKQTPVINCVRRSQRTRLPVLEHWRNERPIFRRDSTAFTIVDVNPGFEPMDWNFQTKKRTKIAAKADKLKLKSGRHKLAIGDTVVENVFEDVNGVKLSDIMVVDPTTQDEVYIDCVRVKKSYLFCALNGNPATEKDPVVVTKALSQKAFSTGALILKPGEEKGTYVLQNDTMVFWILLGMVRVTIHETTFILSTNDTFFVPQGNTYNIKNLSSKDVAQLAYFQHKG